MRSYLSRSVVWIGTLLVVVAGGMAAASPPLGGNIPVPHSFTHKVDLKIYCLGAVRTQGFQVDQHCGVCDTNLARVDAVYLPSLGAGIEEIQPYDPNDHWNQVHAQLKLTYYDLALGRRITKTVPVSIRRGKYAIVPVINHPVLIKRSAGITAEVSVAPPLAAMPHAPFPIGFRDTNTANNRMTIHGPGCVWSPVE